MKLENPFLRRPSLTQSIDERNTYISRWGSFRIDPVAARLGSRNPSAGLLLYHPDASTTDRRKVGFCMMFNGPDAMMHGSIAGAAVMALFVVLAPFSYPVSLGWGLLAGFAAWGLLALISARASHHPWHTAVLWWPQRLNDHASDPDLEPVVTALSTLDNTPSETITPAEYHLRWRDIYDQAAELKTQRVDP